MEKKTKKIVGLFLLLGLFFILIMGLEIFHLKDLNRVEYDFFLSNNENIEKADLMNYLDYVSRKESYHEKLYLFPFGALILIYISMSVFFVTIYESEQKKIDKNVRIVLKFLSKDERIIVNRLLDNEGYQNQSNFSKLPGLTKIKSHRILINLEQKGILKKEKHGKINKIILNKEIYDVLKV